jgi:hypothetical protein
MIGLLFVCLVLCYEWCEEENKLEREKRVYIAIKGIFGSIRIRVLFLL